jgi:hypothetical protein
MDKKDIAALLDALCDRPLAAEAELSPALQALCSVAAEALSGPGDGAPGPTADPDVAAAVVAAIHSGTESEAERTAFLAAAARSAAFRLDMQSALAFVESIEQAAEPAPAHLVATLGTASARPAMRWRDRAWRLLATPQRWRMASALTVVLAAGALASGLYLRPGKVERDDSPTTHPTLNEQSAPATPTAVVGEFSRSAVRPKSAADGPPAGATAKQATKFVSCPPPDDAPPNLAPPSMAPRSVVRAAPSRHASGSAAALPAQTERDCGPPDTPAIVDTPADLQRAGRAHGVEATLALRRAAAARRAETARQEAARPEATRQFGAAKPQPGSAAAPGAYPSAVVRPATPPVFGDHAPAAATTAHPSIVDPAK